MDNVARPALWPQVRCDPRTTVYESARFLLWPHDGHSRCMTRSSPSRVMSVLLISWPHSGQSTEPVLGSRI